MAKKILFVVNVDWFFISHRLPIALRALKEGYSVHIACADSGEREYLESLGFTFHDVPFSRSGSSIKRELETLFTLNRLIRALAPEIVHAVTIKSVLYSGLCLRFHRKYLGVIFAISGLGYVFTAESFRARFTRRIVAALYKFSLNIPKKVVIFQNDTDEKVLSETVKISDMEKVKIRGSGADLSTYRAEPEEAAKPIVVVMACRLLKEKGVYEFVESARRLQGSELPIKFKLAGPIDSENPSAVSIGEVERWVDEGLIEYLGPRDDMPFVFARSHIVVLPSYYGEGVPKVLIEAAACGRPIITSNNPGCRDAVVNGKTGLLIPIKDSEALASAIRLLSVNSQLRKDMGAAGRKFAELEFDVVAVVDKHMEIYSHFLNGAATIAKPLSNKGKEKLR